MSEWKTVTVNGVSHAQGRDWHYQYTRYVHYPNFLKLLLCVAKAAIEMQLSASSDGRGHVVCTVKVTEGKE